MSFDSTKGLSGMMYAHILERGHMGETFTGLSLLMEKAGVDWRGNLKMAMPFNFHVRLHYGWNRTAANELQDLLDNGDVQVYALDIRNPHVVFEFLTEGRKLPWPYAFDADKKAYTSPHFLPVAFYATEYAPRPSKGVYRIDGWAVIEEVDH